MSTLTGLPCVLDGCEAPGGTKGYCNRHYLRLYRHGSPVGGGRGRATGGMMARIASEIQAVDGCLLWTGSTTKAGYANGRVAGRYVLLHRWLYEETVGAIPAGMTIDHRCHNEATDCPGGVLCRHRRCLNPEHHEVVSHRTNILRSRRRKNLEAQR